MNEYTDLMDAQELLQKVRISHKITGSHNPAWMKLFNAAQYLEKQAAAILADPQA
jgi:hypothetical protein